MLRGLAIGIALISVTACDPPPGAPSDAGRDAAFGVLPVLSGDFSCLGSRTAPVAGAAVDAIVTITPFMNPDPILNFDLRVFRGDRVALTCEPAECLPLTSDPTGAVAVTLPAPWFAMRYFPRFAADLPGILVHQAPSAAFPVTSITRTAASTVVGIIHDGLDADFGLGLAAARLEDCAGARVSGAVILVEVEGEPILDGVDGAVIGYFDAGELPVRGARYTSASGLFGAANLPVPVPLARARLEAWGVLREGDPPQRIACETVPLEPGTLSSTTFGPVRSDYDMGDLCM